MRRSLRLAAYRTLSRHANARAYLPTADRRAGTLVWVHVPEGASRLALDDLAQRLVALRPEIQVLITQTGPVDAPEAEAHSRILVEQTPSEHPDAVAAFLAHWQPVICLWAWGDLRPNLVLQSHAAGCRMILADSEIEGLDSRRERWLPEVSRQILSVFTHLHARSPAAQKRLFSLGVAREQVALVQPLQAGGHALPCEDSDLADLSAILAGRPVWLASGIQAAEIAPVLSAHRQALRYSHRLLLVVHPDNPDLMEQVRSRGEDADFRVRDWSVGEDPEEDTQILVTRDAEDLGLFYRVAPVCFLGSSLTPGFGGRNPFEAATLGSAVLYGPNVRRYLPFYSRLANAGAARIVNDAASLGTAVTRLIAPDQAASMACAGWDVISEGASVTDQIIALVDAALDAETEGSHART